MIVTTVSSLLWGAYPENIFASLKLIKYAVPSVNSFLESHSQKHPFLASFVFSLKNQLSFESFI